MNAREISTRPVRKIPNRTDLLITVAFEDVKPYEQKPLTKKMMGSRSRTGNHERYESPVPGLENFLRGYPLAEVK